MPCPYADPDPSNGAILKIRGGDLLVYCSAPVYLPKADPDLTSSKAKNPPQLNTPCQITRARSVSWVPVLILLTCHAASPAPDSFQTVPRLHSLRRFAQLDSATRRLGPACPTGPAEPATRAPVRTAPRVGAAAPGASDGPSRSELCQNHTWSLHSCLFKRKTVFQEPHCAGSALVLGRVSKAEM